MQNRYLYAFLMLILLTSCQGGTPEPVETSKSKVEQQQTTFVVKESIAVKYKKQLSDWRVYQDFSDFLLRRLQKATTTQALANSDELLALSVGLKDSILPSAINDISLNARLNLLHSESLRLHDMASINAIEDREITQQVYKIFDAYSFVNAKVNAMLEQQELERLYKDDFQIIPQSKKDSIKTKQTNDRIVKSIQAKQKKRQKLGPVSKRKKGKQIKSKVIKPVKNE